MPPSALAACSSYGEPADPVALLAHGAASTARFVLDTFGPGLAALGWRTVSWQRPAGAPVEPALEDLAHALQPGLVGGVSLGAHAVGCWAARTGYRGRLLLALPAWTGPVGAAAALTEASATELERAGLEPTLAAIRARAHPWVAHQVARAWPVLGAAGVVAELRAAARAAAPGAAELTRLRPSGCAVLGLEGDPVHPVEVARRWAALIRGAQLTTARLDAAAGPDFAAALYRVSAISGPRSSRSS